jgi:hypothetical protein
MNAERVADKSQMCKLLKLGEFGNTMETWMDWLSWERRTRNPWRVSLRTRKPGGEFISGCSPNFVSREHLTEFYVSEIAPHHAQSIQGEFTFEECGPYLYYTYDKDYMRKALVKDPHHARGVKALSLLRFYLDGTSFENMMDLCDRFYGACIEFTAFERSVGTLGWNTVFWEVRHY